MREIKRAESHDSANSMTLREYLDNLETVRTYEMIYSLSRLILAKHKAIAFMKHQKLDGSSCIKTLNRIIKQFGHIINHQ